MRVWDCLEKILTQFYSKCCRSTRLLCRPLRGFRSRCDTAGTHGVCNACTSRRCCKIYRTARRIARICVLDGIVRRRTPWAAPFFSGTVDQPSASCEHKAGYAGDPQVPSKSTHRVELRSRSSKVLLNIKWGDRQIRTTARPLQLQLLNKCTFTSSRVQFSNLAV